MNFSHSIKVGSLDDDEHFPLHVEHMFGKKLSYVRGVLKCPSSLRDI
jgi:hypothetical protein